MKEDRRNKTNIIRLSRLNLVRLGINDYLFSISLFYFTPSTLFFFLLQSSTLNTTNPPRLGSFLFFFFTCYCPYPPFVLECREGVSGCVFIYLFFHFKLNSFLSPLLPCLLFDSHVVKKKKLFLTTAHQTAPHEE